MDHSFWHTAWARKDKPGWQQDSANDMLQNHWTEFGGTPGETVFVPMCGRSPDLTWLHQYGHHVIGVDLSLTAVQQFCDESDLEFSTSTKAGFTIFSAEGFTLYVGDFFALQADQLVAVSRVYDRASLIAMPPELRSSYAKHLQSIIPPFTAIFTIAISYDQAAMQGPPFSVPESEVRELYANNYKITTVHRETSSMERRGLATLDESVYWVLPGEAS